MNRRSSPNSRETELGKLLEMLHGLASGQVFHHMSRTMHQVDLSFSQVTALVRLHRLGPQNIAALAEGVHLSHPAASRLVEKLVNAGLAIRKQDPDNRRQKIVRLSKKGGEYLKELRAGTALAYAGLFADVPQSLRDELRSVLGEIRPYLAAGSCDPSSKPLTAQR